MHNEAGANHAECDKRSLRLEGLRRWADDTGNDAFIESVDWNTLATLKVTTAAKIASRTLALDMGMIELGICDKIVNASSRPDSQSRLLRLLHLFKAWILCVSPTRKGPTQSARLRLFLDGEYEQLHRNMLDMMAERSKPKPKGDDAVRRTVIKQAGVGQLGKAMDALINTATVADVDDEKYAQILLLFPQPAARSGSAGAGVSQSAEAADEDGEPEPSGPPTVDPLPPERPAVELEEEAGTASASRAASPLLDSPLPPRTENVVLDDTASDTSEASRPLPAEDEPGEPSQSAVPRKALAVTRRAMEKAIQAAPRHTAPARSGFRLDHARFIARAFPPVAQAWADIANLAAQNLLAPEAAAYMWGGSITALNKSGGGVRPVVPVESLARLISRAILHEHKKEIQGAFQRVQTCLQPDGMLALTTAARAALVSDPECVLLKLDARNAYNSVERPAVEAGLQKIGLAHFTDYFRQAYGQSNNMMVTTNTGPRILEMSRGVIQGEGASSFLFCCAIQPLLLEALAHGTKDEDGEPLAADVQAQPMAYADDILLVGKLEGVRRLFRFLKPRLAEVGLSINPGKCTLACATTATLDSAAVFAEAEGFGSADLQSEAIEVLGTPLGAPEAVRKLLQDKIAALRDSIGKLLWLEDKQTAMLLMRFCVVQRANHLLRSLPPSALAEFTAEYDAQVHGFLARMVEPSTLTDHAKLIASLPVSQGGLGITPLAVTSKAAYLGGLADAMRSLNVLFPALEGLVQDFFLGDGKDALELQDVVDFFNDLRARLHEEQVEEDRQATPDAVVFVPPSPPTPHTVAQALGAPPKEQGRLRHLVMHERLAEHKRIMESRHRLAQYLSSKELGAGTLWHVLPSSPNLRLSSEHTRIAMCLRLCIDTATVPSKCNVCCLCGRAIPRDGRAGDLATDHHLATCSRDGFLAKRHKQVQTAIRQEAALRGQLSELAPRIGNTTPALFADLIFPNISGKGGKGATVVDVSVCHFSASPSRDVDMVPLASSAAREQEKMDKYRAVAEASQLDFMPLVFESTGALGQSAKDFFKLLTANSCMPSEDTSSQAEFESIIQPVIVALHKSMGDKFITASKQFRGLAYRYNDVRLAAEPRASYGQRGRRGD